MPSDDMIKPTNEDIIWTVKRVSPGNFTVQQASRTYGVNERRVN